MIHQDKFSYQQHFQVEKVKINFPCQSETQTRNRLSSTYKIFEFIFLFN